MQSSWATIPPDIVALESHLSEGLWSCTFALHMELKEIQFLWYNNALLYQGCSETKWEAMYGMGTQFKLRQAHSVLFLLFAIILWTLKLFYLVGVKKWPSSCTVLSCFYILPEVFSHSKLVYSKGKKPWETHIIF